jgi:DNA-binding GntR family transcriptional regulator
MSNLGLNVLRTVSLRQQVTDSLRESILEGNLRPGQKLIERELCEEMQISRTVLREALQHLEAEGIIVNVPPKGRAVVAISQKEAKEIFDVRRAMEAVVMKDFRRNASEMQIAELRQKLDRLDASDSKEDMMTIEGQITSVIMKVSGNRTATDILAQLNNRIMILRRLPFADRAEGGKRRAELRALLSSAAEHN